MLKTATKTTSEKPQEQHILPETMSQSLTINFEILGLLQTKSGTVGKKMQRPLAE